MAPVDEVDGVGDGRRNEERRAGWREKRADNGEGRGRDHGRVWERMGEEKRRE